MSRFNLFLVPLAIIGLLSIDEAAMAQATQPPPPAVPVPDVGEEALAGGAAQVIEGTAWVVDGDEIVVGDKPVRLYGIAAPDITANLGPDARLALDTLVGGQRVTCQALDRDKSGNAIAVCKLGTDDIARQMLAQGLSAVYRVSQNPTAAEREMAGANDAAEADARTQGVGLWLKKPVESMAPIQAMPEPEPALPPHIAGLTGRLGGALIIGLAILLAAASMRKAESREARRAGDAVAQNARTLTAILSSEILAIRASAEEQYEQTASCVQDLPIPGGQSALLGLPPAVVYNANGDRLHILSREVSVDLVQFYAQHAHVSRLIAQAPALRCETLRAALKGLVEAAVQPMKQAEKVLS